MMKTESKIFAAFVLNLVFAVFEFAGGILTGSVAIVSDAVHDLGDAVSIGISCALEEKSKRPPDETYTYGYARFSVLGGAITLLVLLVGSVTVTFHAIRRLMHPAEVDCNGMIVFAIVGAFVNFGAAYFTHGGETLNEKAVHLHMLEDVLGWVVVLVGAVVMRFTGFVQIDPLLSVGVTVWIFANAVKGLKEIAGLFLERVPCGMDLRELREHLLEVDGVLDVHHIHVRSMDGHSICATMHIVTDADFSCVKEAVREELKHFGIVHATLEPEGQDEPCGQRHCSLHAGAHTACHHGHP